MTKKAKPPKLSSPSELSEDTLIMDPTSSARTQQMKNPPDHPMEATLILHPGAGDITASGTEPGPASPVLPAAERAPQPDLEKPSANLPPLGFELDSGIGQKEMGTPRPYGLWAGLGAGLLILLGAFWYFDKGKPAPVSISLESEGQQGIPAPVPAAYQETLRQAQGGDVAAMRTLGAVYTYGLGVPPHRQEGLRWYRKAAEAGSVVAAEEAKAMEGPSKQ